MSIEQSRLIRFCALPFLVSALIMAAVAFAMASEPPRRTAAPCIQKNTVFDAMRVDVPQRIWQDLEITELPRVRLQVYWIVGYRDVHVIEYDKNGCIKNASRQPFERWRHKFPPTTKKTDA